jgi:hypothetical protein
VSGDSKVTGEMIRAVVEQQSMTYAEAAGVARVVLDCLPTPLAEEYAEAMREAERCASEASRFTGQYNEDVIAYAATAQAWVAIAREIREGR